MEHKEAADILINLINAKKLDSKEEQAVLTAIGVLAWTKLAESRIKNKRAKNKGLKS